MKSAVDNMLFQALFLKESRSLSGILPNI